MNAINIRVAEQFTRYPAGRNESDGPFSGERFRKEFLEPALSGGHRVVIYLDGTRGYGSSFLEEAFGGLVRKGYTPDRLNAALEFDSNDASLVAEIRDYIVHGGDE